MNYALRTYRAKEKKVKKKRIEQMEIKDVKEGREIRRSLPLFVPYRYPRKVF